MKMSIVKTITKYISKNKKIKICLIERNVTYIDKDTIFLNYLDLENNDILQKIISCQRYISLDCHIIFSYYKISKILSYVNEISITNDLTNENIVNIIDESINLQTLRINSKCISNIDFKNKLHEKHFLKYIQIVLTSVTNLDDIYQIMEIKSLYTLYLYDIFNDNLDLEKILKILYYIFNNLNKNIKLGIYHNIDDKLKKHLSLVTYNFKVNKFDYIFTYIPPAFKNFGNLHDFNLYYQ